MREDGRHELLCASGVAALVLVSACGNAPMPPHATPMRTTVVSTDRPAKAPASNATADAPPATVPPVIVLERPRCRTASPMFRLELGSDGSVVYLSDGGAWPGQHRAAIDPRAVRALAERLESAGIARWGHADCTPNAAVRCSMHPCTTTIRVVRDGTAHVASVTDDANSPPVGFSQAAADVERTARAWRWMADAFDTSIPGACQNATDCTVTADSCGSLHPAAIGERRLLATSDPCALSTWPRGGVEPACVEGRCALEPVDDDGRACERDRDCVAVRLGCDGSTAVRIERVHDLAVRNDHLRCRGSAPPLPHAACLRHVCVTRAHE